MNKTNRLAITVDIEDWYHIPSVTGSPFAHYKTVEEFFESWTGRFDYLTRPTMRVLEMLEELSIQATFFIVGDVTEKYPGLVTRISQAGHEIACHGLHHACAIDPSTKKPLMSRDAFLQRTRAAKETLEAITGEAVLGYRAPAAYIAGWMVDCLEELGFHYDSSVATNSLYNKSDSTLTGVGTVPYWPKKGDLVPGPRRSIVEIPWPSFRLFLRFPTGGGPLLRLLGRHYVQRGLRSSLKRGDSVLYFHPIDICAERFPASFSTRRPFYWSVKGPAVEKRILWLLRRHAQHTATCREIAAVHAGESG